MGEPSLVERLIERARVYVAEIDGRLYNFGDTFAAEIARLTADLEEEARLNGMGSEREAGLHGEIARLTKRAAELEEQYADRFEYAKIWQERAEKAEAERDAMRKALAPLLAMENDWIEDYAEIAAEYGKDNHSHLGVTIGDLRRLRALAQTKGASK